MTVARMMVPFFSCFWPLASIFSFDHLKRALCRLCAHQKLWQEHGTLLKSFSHDIQRRNDLAVDDVQGILGIQQFPCRLHSLVFKPFHNAGMQIRKFPGCLLPCKKPPFPVTALCPRLATCPL